MFATICEGIRQRIREPHDSQVRIRLMFETAQELRLRYLLVIDDIEGSSLDRFILGSEKSSTRAILHITSGEWVPTVTNDDAKTISERVPGSREMPSAAGPIQYAWPQNNDVHLAMLCKLECGCFGAHLRTNIIRQESGVSF